MKTSAQRPRARVDNLVVQEMDDELLIYDLDRDKAHCLNGEAASVFRLCDGVRTVREIGSLVMPDSPEDIREEVVWLALSQLDGRRLLSERLAEVPQGISRRDLMRKAAIAGVVVLAFPVVRSIVAPTAAQAATCLGNGAACSTGAQCCSGICSGGFCVGSRPEVCIGPGFPAPDPSKCCSGQTDGLGICL